MPRPVIIVVYGFSKSGKTVDALFSFPEAAFFLPVEGGLSPWTAFTGIEPKYQVVQTLDDVTVMITQLPAGLGAGRFLVMDDFTILAEQSLTAYMRGGLKGKQLWGALLWAVYRFRDAATSKGISLVLNCHEREPGSDDTGFVKGLPRMPSKNMSTALPHIASLVLRTSTDMNIPKPLWNGAYLCDSRDRTYLTGDRFGVLGTKTPMNLREILRLAGESNDVAVPARPESVQWIAPYVEELAQSLMSIPQASHEQVAQKLVAAFPDVDPRHLRWMHRDGFARAHLRKNTMLAAYLPQGAMAMNGTAKATPFS